jgi:integrase
VKRERRKRGSLFLDKRVNTWYLQWSRNPDGKRMQKTLGTVEDFPTKSKARREADKHLDEINGVVKFRPADKTFGAIAKRYMQEAMPTRSTTAGAYRNYIENYAIPKWGELLLDEVVTPPANVQIWLEGLERAPKTRFHIKGVMRLVYDFAMSRGEYPIARNPIELVKLKGSTKRTKKVKILTYEEWSRFLKHLTVEPYRTMVILALCLGIRREEVWALKWEDFDFTTNTVTIQRAIVGGKVFDTVKTDASEAPLPLDDGLVGLLLAWRSRTEFKADSDWVWASRFVEGRMPYYLNAVQRDYIIPASIKAGLGKIGWHCFRHTYRSWLNDAGTPLGVQKDLMRHANISTTANVYGGAMPKSMREANSKVVRQVIQ